MAPKSEQRHQDKQVEERLRQSEERYSSLFDRMLDGIYLSTHEGRFVDVNPALVKMFGYSSKQEMLAIADIKNELYFSPEERESHVLDTGQEEVEAYRMRRKDGSEIWVEDHARYIHDEQGNLIYHEGILRDVTERKRTEEILRESEEKYRMIFQNSPLGIFRSTFEGRLLEVNPALANMFRYESPETMIGEIHDVAEQLYVHAEDRQRIVAGQIGTADITHHINRYRRKDGTEYIANLYLKTIRDVEGRPISLEGIVEDITERRRLEEELKQYSTHLEDLVKERSGKLAESEKKFRELAELLPEVVFETDEDGNFSFLNKAGLTYSGFSDKDLRNGLNVLQVIAPEDRDRAKENFRRQMNGEGLGSREYTALRKDGGTYPLTIHAAPIIHEGKLVGLRGIGIDMTERKRTEEMLREREAFLEAIVENIPNMIFLKDAKELRFVRLNKTGEDLIGYRREDLIGKSDYDFFPVEQADYFVQKDRQVLEGRMLVDIPEEPVLTKEKGQRILHTKKIPILDESGRPQYLLGISEDITERKRVEEALSESEARYRLFFESSPIALWEEDFSEVKKYLDDLRSRGVKDIRSYFNEHPEDLDKCASRVKIVNVNETTLRLYCAKTVEELRGELRRVFTYEFHDKFREELVALGEGKTQFVSEFDNQTLTGDTKHVDLILSVIPGYEDTLAKVLVSIIDLTERKEMQERLQQAERLAAVGETAAMVAHDLRNPLQGITGAVDLLKQESLTAKERDEMLRLIEGCVHYSDAIVRDLMEYSTEIHLKPVETTPDSITRDAVRTVKVPKNVTLRDMTQEHPTIRVDQDKMRRVIINIVENAIDAMPQGGTLTISSSQSNSGVEITISDTGSGIPDRFMKNLWKPLQTTKAKGLGLGLAICKRIVEAHGGNISVKSKIGEGTTVTIRLPIKPEAVEVKQK